MTHPECVPHFKLFFYYLLALKMAKSLMGQMIHYLFLHAMQHPPYKTRDHNDTFLFENIRLFVKKSPAKGAGKPRRQVAMQDKIIYIDNFT